MNPQNIALITAFNGTNQRELADRFKLTQNAVYRIIHRAQQEQQQCEAEVALDQALDSDTVVLWVGLSRQLADPTSCAAVMQAAQMAAAKEYPADVPVALIARLPGPPAVALPTSPGMPVPDPAENQSSTPSHAGTASVRAAVAPETQVYPLAYPGSASHASPSEVNVPQQAGPVATLLPRVKKPICLDARSSASRWAFQ